MRYIYEANVKIGYRESGSIVVEFALVLILLLIIVAGIIEFGRAFWYYDALAKATRDGARFLSTVSVSKVGDLAKATTAPSNCTDKYTDSDPITANRIVYCAAIAANVPDFDLDNVNVQCDGGACVNGTAPEYIKVSIEGYPVTIGGWIPFILPTGGVTEWTLNLSPATTMRYIR